MRPLEAIAEVIAAVRAAADPAHALAAALDREPADERPVVLLASGKAAAPMLEAALPRLAGRVRAGAVTCVPEHGPRCAAAIAGSGLADAVLVYPADHPFASARNVLAAEAFAAAARDATPAETVVALLSGGASAHLTLPADGVTLDDLVATSGALMRGGATITHLNAVRKHAERLKGGRLAALCAPTPVRVFVLSDVLEDPLDVIGSGPFAPDPTTIEDALAALDAAVPGPAVDRVRAHLRSPAAQETPKPGSPAFRGVRHTVIANNTAAVDAACSACARLGFSIVERRTGVTGEASEVAKDFAGRLVAHAGSGVAAAMVWGGETTVTVGRTAGLGGRNTEFALAAALAIDGRPGLAIAAYATDGVDGPTDAAGAAADGTIAGRVRASGVDPVAALATHDSYTALDSASALIRTGPSGTNVNDVLIGLACPASHGA